MKVYVVLKAALQSFGEFSKTNVESVHLDKLQAEANLTKGQTAWQETLDGVVYICERSVCELDTEEPLAAGMSVYIVLRACLQKNGDHTMITIEQLFVNKITAENYVKSQVVWNEKLQHNYVCERSIIEAEIT